MKFRLIGLFFLIPLISLNAQVSTDILDTSEKSQSFITLQGITLNCIGDFKQAWKSASGGYVGFGMISSNQWALIFQTGYLSFSPNEEMNYTGEASFNLVPLTVGTRYYILPDIFRPFLLANGGINLVSQKYTLDDVTVDETRSHFHFQIGAGIGVKVSSDLEIEVLAKYNSHLLDPALPLNITGFEYGLALDWHLDSAN
jgi:hypothetical protein